jgi:hypothetical protein
MLRKLSRKSVLLFAIALATPALAIPSLASGASWGTIGTTHNFDSANLGFVAHNSFIVAGGAAGRPTFRSMSAMPMRWP